MSEKGKMSYTEAVSAWIDSMNAIPTSLVEAAMKGNPDCVREVTVFRVGDSVRVWKDGRQWPDEGDYGVRVAEQNSDGSFVVEDFKGRRCTVDPNDSCDFMEFDSDGILPMWGTMWMFRNQVDKDWISWDSSIRKMSSCGFRVYDTDFGYMFGIDGCGYDFTTVHFAPLYKARGLRWHSTDLEGKPVASVA